MFMELLSKPTGGRGGCSKYAHALCCDEGNDLKSSVFPPLARTFACQLKYCCKKKKVGPAALAEVAEVAGLVKAKKCVHHPK